MDLIHTLSFNGENESELDRKRRLLDTLDFLDRLEEESEEEVAADSSSTSSADELIDLDLSVKSRVTIESSESFELSFGQSFLQETFYFFSHTNAIEEFRRATGWILRGEASVEAYFYASHLDVLLLVRMSEGQLALSLPRTFLALRKYLAEFLADFTVNEDISNDREYSSALQFSCSLEQGKAILLNFGQLSQKDAVLQIYSPSPFIYATIMPNEISAVKRTRKIVQHWNEQSQSSEIVESVSYSQTLTGMFSGGTFIYDLLSGIDSPSLSMRFETVSWSSFGNSIQTVERQNRALTLTHRSHD